MHAKAGHCGSLLVVVKLALLRRRGATRDPWTIWPIAGFMNHRQSILLAFGLAVWIVTDFGCPVSVSSATE